MLNSLTMLSDVETMVYLVNLAIVSVVLCALGLLAVQLLRSSSAPLRHGILVATMLLVLISPAALWLGQAHNTSLLSIAVLDLSGTTAVVPAEMSAKHEPIDSDHDLTTVPNSSSAEVASALSQLETAIDAANDQEFKAGAWVLLGFALASMWAIGVAWGTITLALDGIRLRRFRASLARLDDPRMQNLAGLAARTAGLKQTPSLASSHNTLAPLCMGLTKPLIVLPIELVDELDDEQMTDVLVHEMAHVARRDPAISLACRIVVVVFWWNPLAYRVRAQIDDLREQICDNFVCRNNDTTERFAHTLVELAARAVLPRNLPTAVGILQPGGLTMRITRLLNKERNMETKMSSASRLVTLLVAGAGLTLLLLGAGLKVAQSEPPQPAAERPAAQEPPQNQTARVAPAQDKSDTQQPNKLMIMGLDLTQAPTVQGFENATDLWERAPGDPGKWKHLDEVFSMPLETPDRKQTSWLRYPVTRGRFYVTYRSDENNHETEQTYGPFEGDPFKRLKLDERLVAQMHGKNFGTSAYMDAYLRLGLMLKTDNAAMAKHALQLVETALDGEGPLDIWSRHMDDVARMLDQYAPIIEKHGQTPAAQRIRTKLAAKTKNVADAIAEIPIEQYIAQDSEPAKVTIKIPDTAWGEAKNGLRLAAVPNPDTAALGAEIPFWLIVENVSGHDIKFSTGISLQDAQAEVRDTNRNQVETQLARTRGATPIKRYRLRPGQQAVLMKPSVMVVEKGNQVLKAGATNIVLPGDEKLRNNPFIVRYSVPIGEGSASWSRGGGGAMQRTFPAKGDWTGTLTSGQMAINGTRPQEAAK